MFTLQPSETFKATVTVQVATETGGWKTETFTGIFKRTDDEQREELLALKNTDLMRRVMVGGEMKDDKRQSVEFTDANFEAFLRLTGAVRESMLTYWQHNAGAKAKN